jgi:glutamate/tyrosine decarboxylase-like PLP-dependent enzyme
VRDRENIRTRYLSEKLWHTNMKAVIKKVQVQVEKDATKVIDDILCKSLLDYKLFRPSLILKTRKVAFSSLL